MNYKDRASFFTRYYAKRTSMFFLSYQILNYKRVNIFSVDYCKKLHNITANLCGYKIENNISKDLIYYVDNIFPNKIFPNGFYDSNWKPLAILGETYFGDIPMDLGARKTMIKSIDKIFDTAIPIIDSYSSDCLASKIFDKTYPGEILRSVIIPQSAAPFLICDFPRRWTCKRIVVVRDCEGNKVLHIISDINQSYFNPIMIRVSRRMVKANLTVLLYSALRALDSVRPELNN